MVSNLHAFWVCYLAYDAAFVRDGGAVWASPDFFMASPATTNTCYVLIAYIASDLLVAVWHIRDWKNGEANLIHHTTAIACYWMLINDQFAHAHAMFGAICELTTPIVNQRWFFDKAGMKASPLYLANGILMLVTWFVLRVVVFGWMGVRLWGMRLQVATLSWDRIVMVIGSYGIGYALQLFWFRKILMGAIKAVLGAGKKTKGL